MNQEHYAVPAPVAKDLKQLLPRFVYDLIAMDTKLGCLLKDSYVQGQVSQESLALDVESYYQKRYMTRLLVLYQTTVFLLLFAAWICYASTNYVTAVTIAVLAIAMTIFGTKALYVNKERCIRESKVALLMLNGFLNATLSSRQITAVNTMIEQSAEKMQAVIDENRELAKIIKEKYHPLLQVIKERDRKLYTEHLAKNYDDDDILLINNTIN